MRNNGPMKPSRLPTHRVRLMALALCLAALLPFVTATVEQGAQFSVPDATRGFLLSRTSMCENDRILNWNCGDACERNPTFTPYAVHDKTASDGTLAITGVDHDKQEIIVVFRASDNAKNWVANLDFLMTPLPRVSGKTVCPGGCYVHRGILNSYLSLQTNIRADVAALRKAYPSYSFFLAGHSLGGAIAEVCAADIATGGDAPSDPRAITVYTYGSFRVGNRAFSSWLTNLIWGSRTASTGATGHLFRVTHAKDPINHLPPLSLGYRHAATEIFYKSANSPDVYDYRTCRDDGIREDRKCSLGVFADKPDDHGYYMGMCSICHCTGDGPGGHAGFTLTWSLLWGIFSEYVSNIFDW